MKLYTIGFTQTTAESFFGRLLDAGVARVLDVRLQRDGQLAGFAKARDLPFFLRELAGADYHVLDMLAPTAEMLTSYRERATSWDEYAAAYTALLDERRPEASVSKALLDRGALLCSEATAEKCHRRVAAEYFAAKLGGLDIVHL